MSSLPSLVVDKIQVYIAGNQTNAPLLNSSATQASSTGGLTDLFPPPTPSHSQGKKNNKG